MKIFAGLGLVLVGLMWMLTSNQGTITRYHDDHVERSWSSVNPPAAKTGAPGEGNCTGCHLGTAQSADGIVDVSFSGAGDEYIVGQQYNITVSIATGTKNGFQMTALDELNAKAGTFVPGTGTSVTTSGGKQYVRHTVSTGMLSWTFSWTAPDADAGDLTLYYAFNKSNAANNSAGDVIYIGQKTITSAVFNTLTSYEKTDQDYAVYYDGLNRQLHFSYALTREAQVVFSVQDLSGRLVHQVDFKRQAAGQYAEQVQLEFQPQPGVYVVSLFVDNNVYNRKIAIP